MHRFSQVQNSRKMLLKICVRMRFSQSAGKVKKVRTVEGRKEGSKVGRDGGREAGREIRYTRNKGREGRKEGRRKTMPSTPTMRQVSRRI